jgi:hypothetical protein
MELWQSMDRSEQSDVAFPKEAATEIPGAATGLELQVQRADVKRGTGTFTLFLPMKHNGWPHVAFCTVKKGGKAFGTVYFGTADSVLKTWWTPVRFYLGTVSPGVNNDPR